MSEKEELISAPHCVQCHKEMPYGITFEVGEKDEKKTVKLQLCHTQGCPNYGIFQLGDEGMPSE